MRRTIPAAQGDFIVRFSIVRFSETATKYALAIGCSPRSIRWPMWNDIHFVQANSTAPTVGMAIRKPLVAQHRRKVPPLEFRGRYGV